MGNGLQMPELSGGDVPPVVPLRIALPEDENRIAALEIKREEYLERIRYKSPDMAGLDDVRYKIQVLDKLFEDGEVSAKDVLEGLRDPDDPREVFAAEEALRVVSDYCLTGGENLTGGSLPEIETASPQRMLLPGFLGKIFPIRRPS